MKERFINLVAHLSYRLGRYASNERMKLYLREQKGIKPSDLLLRIINQEDPVILKDLIKYLETDLDMKNEPK